jgi:isopentenyl-diphosphate delta-isomerase
MEQYNSVVLVDQFGHNLYKDDGTLYIFDKLKAHRYGLLHRAVSIFIFNDRSELLLQRRSSSKYHSRGKWTNTCCTHPLPEETPLRTAQRRLVEEMGLVAELLEIFTFIYQADVGEGLIENEFDHVFYGISNQDPIPNPVEVSDWEWIQIENLKNELIRNPEKYTPWLRQCYNEVIKHRLKIVK